MESCFERPGEFLPERWCTAPHLVKDSAGFRPFGLGDTIQKKLHREVANNCRTVLMRWERLGPVRSKGRDSCATEKLPRLFRT